MKPLWRLYHDGMLVGYFIDEALLNKTMEVVGGGEIRDDHYCDKILKRCKVYRV